MISSTNKKESEFVRMILIVKDEECDTRIKYKLLRFAKTEEQISVKMVKKRGEE